jgi:hypothetical protein
VNIEKRNESYFANENAIPMTIDQPRLISARNTGKIDSPNSEAEFKPFATLEFASRDAYSDRMKDGRSE